MNAKLLFPLVMLAFAPPTHAALLVHESFNYGALADGASMNGVASSAAGTSGNYSVLGAGTAVYQAQGLQFIGLESSGGSVRQTSTATSSNADTILGVTSAASHSGTLYSSHLFRFDVVGVNAASFTSFRQRDGLTSGNTAYLTLQDNGTAVAQLGISYSNTTSAAAGTLAADTTYLAVSRFTRVGQNVSTTAGVADLWVFTEEDYADWRNNGAVEADLGTYASFTASNTYSGSTVNTFASGKSLQQFVRATAGDTVSLSIDELRYGTSLLDVTPVPEPGAFAMVLCSLIAAAFVRRRRS